MEATRRTRKRRGPGSAASQPASLPPPPGCETHPTGTEMRRGHGDRPGAGRRDRRHHPHVGRPRGHAERRRVRALRHLPPGHVRPDVRLRAVRLHHPRGVRRPGPRHHHLRQDHRGALPRLHVPSWHPQHTQDRRHHDRPVRDRGAAPAIPAPDVRRLVSGRLLSVGTRRRQ